MRALLILLVCTLLQLTDGSNRVSAIRGLRNRYASTNPNVKPRIWKVYQEQRCEEKYGVCQPETDFEMCAINRKHGPTRHTHHSNLEVFNSQCAYDLMKCKLGDYLEDLGSCYCAEDYAVVAQRCVACTDGGSVPSAHRDGGDTFCGPWLFNFYLQEKAYEVDPLPTAGVSGKVPTPTPVYPLNFASHATEAGSYMFYTCITFATTAERVVELHVDDDAVARIGDNRTILHSATIGISDATAWTSRGMHLFEVDYSNSEGPGTLIVSIDSTVVTSIDFNLTEPVLSDGEFYCTVPNNTCNVPHLTSDLLFNEYGCATDVLGPGEFFGDYAAGMTDADQRDALALGLFDSCAAWCLYDPCSVTKAWFWDNTGKMYNEVGTSHDCLTIYLAERPDMSGLTACCPV